MIAERTGGLQLKGQRGRKAYRDSVLQVGVTGFSYYGMGSRRGQITRALV